jgi:hypothetical protein
MTNGNSVGLSRAIVGKGGGRGLEFGFAEVVVLIKFTYIQHWLEEKHCHQQLSRNAKLPHLIVVDEDENYLRNDIARDCKEYSQSKHRIPILDKLIRHVNILLKRAKTKRNKEGGEEGLDDALCLRLGLMRVRINLPKKCQSRSKMRLNTF